MVSRKTHRPSQSSPSHPPTPFRRYVLGQAASTRGTWHRHITINQAAPRPRIISRFSIAIAFAYTHTHTQAGTHAHAHKCVQSTGSGCPTCKRAENSKTHSFNRAGNFAKGFHAAAHNVRSPALARSLPHSVAVPLTRHRQHHRKAPLKCRRLNSTTGCPLTLPVEQRTAYKHPHQRDRRCHITRIHVLSDWRARVRVCLYVCEAAAMRAMLFARAHAKIWGEKESDF